MFNLIIAGVSQALTFATEAAKTSFTSLLKSKETVETDKGWVLSAEAQQTLSDMGWLRDKSANSTDEPIVETAVPQSLLPMGYTASGVIFEVEGELRKCSMPTILQAVLGYLAFETTPSENIRSTLGKLQKMSAAEAGKEFRFGKWTGQSVIVALEQAYRFVLDTDAEVLKDLLDTGNEVLRYETKGDHEDILLGLAEEKKNHWAGKNLVGHVLMALRCEYGGEPDPRLELIRGYREYSMDELAPSGLNQAQREKLAEMQAVLIYGDAPNPKDVEEVVAHTEGVAAVKNFILENEWWPFPLFQGDEVVLIEDNANPSSITVPEPLLKWLCKLHHMGVMKYVGAEKVGYGDETVSPVSELDLGDKIPVRPYDSFSDALKVHIDMGKGSEWWTWYMSEQSAKLAPGQLVKLFTILAKNRLNTVEWTTDSQEIHFVSGNEFYTWNFQRRSVDARQYRKAFKYVILNDKPVSSNFILLWLALRALGGFQGLNGTLNSLANLWEREANYGHQWEDDHPTRMVRDNSWAPLGVRMDLVEAFGLTLLNGKFSYDLFLKLISTPSCRHDAYVDKNGMKFLAGNGAGAASLTSISYPTIALEAFDALDAGVNPLLVLALVLPKDELFSAVVEILSGTKPSLIVMRKFGSFWTLNDGAKIPKFLNRAQQGASWNEALVEVEFKGVIIKRSPSLMTVQLNWKKEWVRATEQDEVDFLNDTLK